MSKKHRHDPVEITVAGRNIPVTEPLETYATGKVQRLTRYLDGLSKVQVILAESNSREAASRHAAEATAVIKGHTIRAESSDADMYAAIDGMIDKLHLQLTRTKERTRDHKHKSQVIDEGLEGSFALGPDEADEGTDESSATDDLIVTVKQYTMKPMFSDEAIDEMNELGHSFFVFLNAQTEKVSVVYQRKDGLYGLIEPAFL